MGWRNDTRARLGRAGLGVLLITGAAVAAPRIEVFTTARHPVDPGGFPEIPVYRLDALRTLEDRLSDGLPTDPAAARAMAMRRIGQVRADKSALAEAARAQTGLALAVKYAIGKLPAIVFDGRAVIYGMTDLRAALARYRKWQTRVCDDDNALADRQRGESCGNPE